MIEVGDYIRYTGGMGADRHILVLIDQGSDDQPRYWGKQLRGATRISWCSLSSVDLIEANPFDLREIS